MDLSQLQEALSSVAVEAASACDLVKKYRAHAEFTPRTITRPVADGLWDFAMWNRNTEAFGYRPSELQKFIRRVYFPGDDDASRGDALSASDRESIAIFLRKWANAIEKPES